MDLSFAMFSVIIFAVTFASTTAAAATEDVKYSVYYGADIAEFIKTSCKVTLYPKLCVTSLSSYAGHLRPKQSDLVNAAVIVSLINARNVSVWAAGLGARGAGMSEREKEALDDCLENFGDARDQISESLAELKHLRRNTFKIQMSNVETWMSAALTNEDTCLDGFRDLNATGKVTTMVTGRVQYVCELISNALALVNRFAATGGYEELLQL